jgi:hypothetical protein
MSAAVADLTLRLKSAKGEYENLQKINFDQISKIK